MIQNLLFAKHFGLTKLILVIGPMASFLGTEWITGNVGIGLICSGFFSTITAIWVSRSRIIAAKAAALVSTTQAQDVHMAGLLDRMQDLHQQEIAFWKDSVKRQEKIEVLIRATKHKAFNAYQAAILVIRAYEEELRAKGQRVDPYKPETLREITGAEDRHMIESLFGEDLGLKQIK